MRFKGGMSESVDEMLPLHSIKQSFCVYRCSEKPLPESPLFSKDLIYDKRKMLAKAIEDPDPLKILQ